MTMMDAGKSTQGRTYYLAVISSPENLAKIDRYREIARRLAHPEGLSEQEARALSREGKAFVHIDGGLHASEVAGPQHTLAARLRPAVQGGRAGHEGDARQRRAAALADDQSRRPDDGRRVVPGNVGTPFEVSPLPKLYQEYVGHDNNRDGYMLNMIESRVMEHAWRQWEPQIIHVHHQTSPFPTRIWLPPFAEPIASRVPFLMSREVNMIGMAMAKGLEERGQVGATHMGTGYDAWYPGYIDYKPMLQNIASFWTETALYSYATPKFYTLQDYPADMRDLRPQSLYSSPVDGRLVAAARRGRVHGDGVAVGARLRLEVQGVAADESLSRRAAADRAVSQGAAVRVRRAAAAARSGGGRRVAAAHRVPRRSRVAADAHRRASTACRIRRARG